MISTDRFVHVHEPKTGGSFVTSVLFRLHDVRWTPWLRLEVWLRRAASRPTPYGPLTFHRLKHGTCRDIPPAHQHKTVLATLRNPYDVYVSEYEFGWWKRREFLRFYRAVPGFRRDYPSFPDLTFADWTRLAHDAFAPPRAGEDPDDSPGLWTTRFLRYYFRDEAAARARVTTDDEYAASGAYRADMFDVRFVRTAHLNRELHDFLLDRGYPAADLAFILELGKVKPRGSVRTEAQRWEAYYTPELKQWVRRKERFLFAAFPEFDV